MKPLSCNVLLGLAVLCLAGLLALPTPATAARIHQELQGVPAGAQHLRRLLTNNNNNGNNNNNNNKGDNIKRGVYSEEVKRRQEDPKFQAKQNSFNKGKELEQNKDKEQQFKDDKQRPDSGFNYDFSKQVDNGKNKPEKDGNPKPAKNDKVDDGKGEPEKGSIVVPNRPNKDLPDKDKQCGKYKDKDGGDRCSCSNANDERCGVQVSLAGFQRDFDGQGAVFLNARGP